MGPLALSQRKERSTVGPYAPIPWATRALQGVGQWASTPKGEDNPETHP